MWVVSEGEGKEMSFEREMWVFSRRGGGGELGDARGIGIAVMVFEF